MSARIIVTDAETTAGLACIRELGQAGFRVFAIGRSTTAPSSKSRFTGKYVSSPCPWTEPQNAFESLLKFATDVGAHAVLPVSEATVAATLRWQEYLNSEICLLRANSEVLNIALSKLATFRRCEQLEIPVAPGQVVTTDAQPPEWLFDDFPLVVRTDNSWLPDGTYAKGQTWIVRHQDELWAIDQEMKSLSRDYLIQKWLPGFGCGAFLLMNQGQAEMSYTHERLAEIPWTGGVSARRRVAYDSNLLRLANRFLHGLNLNGIAMLEFRKIRGGSNPTESGEPPILIEMNARPWGSLSLALAAGLPFLSQWYRLKLGHPTQSAFKSVKRHPALEDCGLMTTSIYPGELLFMASVLRSWQNSQLSFPQARQLLVGSLQTLLNIKTQYDFFRINDPLPGLRQGKILLQSLFTGIARRIVSGLKTVRYMLTRFAFPDTQRASLLRSAARIQDLKGAHPKSEKIKNILVVCSGNRCRSPFVEKLLAFNLSPGISIVSRGLQVRERDVPQRFKNLFLGYGVDPSEHKARRVVRADIENADLIIMMEREHILQLVSIYGTNIVKKCALLSELADPLSRTDIRDPYNLCPAQASMEFRRIYSMVMTWLARHDTATNQ